VYQGGGEAEGKKKAFAREAKKVLSSHIVRGLLELECLLLFNTRLIRALLVFCGCSSISIQKEWMVE
jgi:hypothetical protein